MMANGWKTPQEIQEDYNLSVQTFYQWKQACEASPYRDAVIRPTGHATYIIEPRWQDFLTWRSEKREEALLDPHLRTLNN